MGHKLDTPDSRIDEIASEQHGVVTLRQLEEVGLSRWTVDFLWRAQRVVVETDFWG